MTDIKDAYKVPEELIQQIMDKDFLEDIGFEPEYMNKWFVSNIVQRTLSHLFVQSANGSVRLQGTIAGYLKVTSMGASLDNEESFSYTAEAAEETQLFTQPVAQVKVDLTAGDAQIKFTYDGTTYGSYENVGMFGNGIFERAVKGYKIKKITTDFSGIVKGLW